MKDSVVLDCSVAVKWFTAEELSDPALALLYGELRLSVPELFASEFANVLVKSVRRGELEAHQARWMFDATMGRITVMATVPAAKAALDIALEYGISAYDATYLALANALRVRFVTADGRLVRAIAATPLAGQLVALDGFDADDAAPVL